MQEYSDDEFDVGYETSVPPFSGQTMSVWQSDSESELGAVPGTYGGDHAQEAQEAQSKVIVPPDVDVKFVAADEVKEEINAIRRHDPNQRQVIDALQNYVNYYDDHKSVFDALRVLQHYRDLERYDMLTVVIFLPESNEIDGILRYEIDGRQANGRDGATTVVDAGEHYYVTQSSIDQLQRIVEDHENEINQLQDILTSIQNMNNMNMD